MQGHASSCTKLGRIQLRYVRCKKLKTAQESMTCKLLVQADLYTFLERVSGALFRGHFPCVALASKFSAISCSL